MDVEDPFVILFRGEPKLKIPLPFLDKRMGKVYSGGSRKVVQLNGCSEA